MLVIPSIQTPAGYSRAEAVSVGGALSEWERAGFSRLQLVPQSRDGAIDDARMIEEILRDVHPTIQVAGRIRSEDEIDAVLSAGAAYAVVGSRAIEEPDWLTSVAARFPDQIIVSTPARERRTRTRGAVRTLPLDLRDLAGELTSVHLGGLIVTFSMDDEIGYSELALLEDVVEDVGFPVMASGGSPTLTTLRDLEFRGVSATVISATYLSAAFDGPALARSFVD